MWNGESKKNALLTLVGLWRIVWLVEFRHQLMYKIYNFRGICPWQSLASVNGACSIATVARG